MISSEINKKCAYAIYLTPLFWLIGVEQFIWPLVGLYLLVLLLLKKDKIVIDETIYLFAIFLLLQVLSFFMIEEAVRIITFVRNFSMYVGALCFFIVLKNITVEFKKNEIVKALIFVTNFAIYLGLFGLFFLDLTFNALISYVLPEFVKNTSYGQIIAVKSIANDGWFLGFHYYRLSSIFAYATFYAAYLLVILPVYIRYYRNKGNRFLLYLNTSILVINLLFTTSRTVYVVAVIIGFVYLYRHKKFLFYTFLSVGAAFFAFITLNMDFLIDAALNFLYARGGGSTASRLNVYKATLEGIIESPFLGWGTEVDVPGMAYPAGSHSFYLGIAFKHGIFALLTVLLFYFSLWLKSFGKKFSFESKVVLLAVCLISFTEVIDLDGLFFSLFIIIIGLLLYSRPHKGYYLIRKGYGH